MNRMCRTGGILILFIDPPDEKKKRRGISIRFSLYYRKEEWEGERENTGKNPLVPVEKEKRTRNRCRYT